MCQCAKCQCIPFRWTDVLNGWFPLKRCGICGSFFLLLLFSCSQVVIKKRMIGKKNQKFYATDASQHEPLTPIAIQGKVSDSDIPAFLQFNVCFKKTGTKGNSSTLLCFVPVFMKWTLVKNKTKLRSSFDL